MKKAILTLSFIGNLLLSMTSTAQINSGHISFTEEGAVEEAAIEQYTLATEKLIEKGITQQQAYEAAINYDKAAHCLYNTFSKTRGRDNALPGIKELRNSIINTNEERQAERENSRLLNGMTFSKPKGNTCRK